MDELLGLPEHVLPLFGLCAGVPEGVPEDVPEVEPGAPPRARPRLPLDAVPLDGRSPTDERMLELIEAFDGTMAADYEARGKPGYDGSGGVSRKFSREQRRHLATYYRSKGARLE